MENLGANTNPGLSDEHATELNGFLTVPVETRRERYALLRRQYADDPVALRQIDVFDKESPYCVALRQLIGAYREGNDAAAQELEAWFAVNYPELPR